MKGRSRNRAVRWSTRSPWSIDSARSILTKVSLA
jgi:hypothetical protein